METTTSIFINNWKTKVYYQIIDNAKNQNRKKKKGIYYESHHIIPKSIIKTNDTVLLTAREHFICHCLLIGMLEGKNKSKMYLAIIRFKNGNVKGHFNSYLYEKLCKNKIEFTEEHKKNIKIAQIGLQFGEKNGMYGKTHTPEAREKIRQAVLGRKASDETKALLSKQRIGNSFSKGNIISPEQREKISKSLMGIKRSEETKKKMSNSKKGRKLSDETKAKISKANKGNTAWNKGMRMEEEKNDF